MYGKDAMEHKAHHYDILDKGYLTLIDYMGADKDIAKSARVSYNNHEDVRTDAEDAKLVNYLMRNHHTSPFEMCEIKFQIKLPLFVKNQWERHRTWQYMNMNEISGRYVEFEPDFYIPSLDRIRRQSLTNKQCSGDELSIEYQKEINRSIECRCADLFKAYKTYLELGCAKEIARIILPLNTYTTLIGKVDLSNLLSFIRLRDHPHAQWEIQEYARALCEIVKDLYPWTWEAFDNHVRRSKTVPGDVFDKIKASDDINEIKKLLGV